VPREEEGGKGGKRLGEGGILPQRTRGISGERKRRGLEKKRIEASKNRAMEEPTRETKRGRGKWPQKERGPRRKFEEGGDCWNGE